MTSPTLRRIVQSQVGRCMSCLWKLPDHAPSCGDRDIAADRRAGDEMAGRA